MFTESIKEVSKKGSLTSCFYEKRIEQNRGKVTDCQEHTITDGFQRPYWVKTD